MLWRALGRWERIDTPFFVSPASSPPRDLPPVTGFPPSRSTAISRPRAIPLCARLANKRRKQSVSYQNSELALLEARIKQAEKLLEEKKQRLAGRSPTSSARSNVPDYAPNPAFSAIAKADEQTAEDGAEPKEGSAAQENGYQARPPPPPPSVPTNV